MQTNAITSRKPRRSRARSLGATLGVTAALAVGVLPMAVPETAEARSRPTICKILIRAMEEAGARGEYEAVNMWASIHWHSGCW